MVRVEASEEALLHVVAKGYRPESGARSIRRFFQDRVEAEIAKLLLATAPAPGSRERAIAIDVSDDTLTFRWSA